MSRSSPASFPSTERAPLWTCCLFNGTAVSIRPVRPGDQAMVGEFIAKLSPEARYFRFDKQFTQPTDSLIHFLTDIDPSKHIALVCTTWHDGREEEIGEARFVKYPGGKTCEFAIAVADAWQGTGVAGRLMSAIEQTARDQGVDIMEGFVLRVNRKMLQFVVARGFTIVPDADDPHTVRVVKRLQ